MKLENKVAVVTGASTGIGRVIAAAFAKEGVFVHLIARSPDRLEKTNEIITAAGGKATIHLADLSNLDSINTLITELKSQINRLDIIANIAGVWHGENEVYSGKDFETFTQTVILDTYSVGLTAPTLLIHALIPSMPKNGKIINLSGTFENGAKGWLPYYVSKRAIEDLTIGLSEELRDKDIQVNGISPSDTATEAYRHYFPQYINEAIAPEKIASHAVYLCTDEANSITGKIFVLKKDQEPVEAFHY